MKQHIKKITTLLLLTSLVSVLTWLTPQVEAQTKQIDLSLTPATDFIEVNPGETTTHKLTLTHNGTLPLVVTPKLVDFSADGQTGKPVLSETTSVDFVTLLDDGKRFGDSFTIKPHSSQVIILQIAPLKNTVEKEYPLTILFQTTPDINTTTSQHGNTVTSAIIGSNIIVSVGQQNLDYADLLIQEVKAPKLIDSFSSLEYQVLAYNQGNKAIPVYGSSRVLDWSDQELISFDLQNDVVLAHSQRLVRPASDSESNPIMSSFVYDPPFLIGPYTIEVTFKNPSQDNISLTVVRYHVFALPFVIVVATLAAISFILILFVIKKQNSLLE